MLSRPPHVFAVPSTTLFLLRHQPEMMGQHHHRAEADDAENTEEGAEKLPGRIYRSPDIRKEELEELADLVVVLLVLDHVLRLAGDERRTGDGSVRDIA